FFFFSSRRRHTRSKRDWSSDVCSSDLGFLITTHLLESLEREGRIRFGAFYAKRARRILPASLLVAALTVVAAWIWMSPLLLESEIGRASCRGGQGEWAGEGGVVGEGEG